MKQSGRPTTYSEETLHRLCAALAEGLSIKAACIACQIGVQTLNDWRKRHPELEQRINHVRELARQEVLQEKRLREPPRKILPPGPRPINWAGKPMLPGDSYGGRFP
ncbi:MAG TPA: hypothetical protein VNY07_12805 [Chthoniobacterales bacterium]|jgi:hypothetical protein|nr:hypothetical protein [Chthoniobacterales bacterium]